MVTIAVDKQFHLTSICMGQGDTVEAVIKLLLERSKAGLLEPTPITRSEFEVRKARREARRAGMPNVIPYDASSKIFKMVYKLED